MSLIRITAVLDGGPEPLLVGEFEPAQVEAVLSILRTYPLTTPEGELCYFRMAAFDFGANGDKPHIEIVAESAPQEPEGGGPSWASLFAKAEQEDES